VSGAISRFGFRAASHKLHVNEQGELIAFGRCRLGEYVKRTYLYRAWTDEFLVRYEPLPGRAGETTIKHLNVADAEALYAKLEVQLVPRDLAFISSEQLNIASSC
jgi:hypothetical protein